MNHDHHDMEHDMCSMNMFINTDTTNLCIVFKQWRITGAWSLIQSLVIITLFAMAFEYLRECTRKYESRPIQLETRERRRQFVKSILYALQVGVSFMLMLVFMTYNVYVMGAVVLGSGMGYYFFNSDPNGASKSMACH